ncbi:MAG TPA: adenosylcobinamide-GDP ribazoletransferase [Candidatus Manganitrophaceae bacterium]|nr:adenosylcobinamide-GDP ribazoletransferase [Candidatus Manganitrophaceae bacterium]
MKSFLTAWHFLTIIPLPVKTPFEMERMGASALYFPLVGLALGGLLLLADGVFSPFFPKTMSSLFLLLILALLTGGIHLDGFADTVDGLAGGGTPEERLRIMRDGRIGSAAVVALFFLLAVKLLALSNLPDAVRWKGLLAFPFIGRSMMIPAAYFSEYPRDSGLGKAFIGKVPLQAGAGAFAFFVFGIFFLFQYKGLMIGMGLTAVSILFVRRMVRKMGGITGDCLGALGEGAEALFLILLYSFYRPDGAA